MSSRRPTRAAKRPTKGPAKRAAAKQTATKQTAANQVTAKQVTAKQATAKRAATKQAATKQAATKQASGKKTPARQASAKPQRSLTATRDAGSSRSLPAGKKQKPKKTHPIKVPPLPEAVERLREICLALPETTEVAAWGEPTFRVAGKIFAMHASSGTHHGDGRPGVWILSVSLEQDLLMRARPDRYFKPPYVGPSGWVGAWLDRDPPWEEIAELLREGWRRRAPKKIAALIPE